MGPLNAARVDAAASVFFAKILSLSLINARLPPFGILKLSPKTSTESSHPLRLASGFICWRWNISPSHRASSCPNIPQPPPLRVWTRYCHHPQCLRQIMGQYFRLMLMFSQKCSHCAEEGSPLPATRYPAPPLPIIAPAPIRLFASGQNPLNYWAEGTFQCGSLAWVTRLLSRLSRRVWG